MVENHEVKEELLKQYKWVSHLYLKSEADNHDFDFVDGYMISSEYIYFLNNLIDSILLPEKQNFYSNQTVYDNDVQKFVWKSDDKEGYKVYSVVNDKFKKNMNGNVGVLKIVNGKEVSSNILAK